MKKYKITGSTEIRWTKVIEASNEEDANEQAVTLEHWSWDSISDYVDIEDGGTTFINDISILKKRK